MKIRNGFVSNSSTSSFLIYGAYLESEDIVTAFKNNIDKIKEKSPDDAAVAYYEESPEDYDDYFEMLDSLSDLMEDKDIDTWCVWDEDYYIGASLRRIKDDETMSQFKDRIGKKIKSIFDVTIPLDIHEEAWRDG